MKVKICGITNKKDALFAAKSGASALGFIFSESPRQISPENAKNIIRQLPPFVKTVGVFVNESIEMVKSTAEYCKLDILQLHGQESPDYCLSMNRPVIKAIRIKTQQDLSHINDYKDVVSGILLDTFVPGKAGGTGETFDWGLAVTAQKYALPVILAGGLTPENVSQAIKATNPYAVDLNSGIEQKPGQKDHHKIIKLFQSLAIS